MHARLSFWFLEYYWRHCDNAEKVDALLDIAEKAFFVVNTIKKTIERGPCLATKPIENIKQSLGANGYEKFLSV